MLVSSHDERNVAAMPPSLLTQARQIIDAAISAVLPDEAVRQALEDITFPGRVILVAAGKAAWRMAKTARELLGPAITDGIVITKYGHPEGPIEGLDCREAGHPVPDAAGFAATQAALELVTGLCETDTVLLLLSGGGSALFEKPLIPPEELAEITRQLLTCGADITEINTIRKRLSAVKGGRFALACAPARVHTIVLSDVLGEKLDIIASGPACPDSSTCSQALAVAEKYGLQLSATARQWLETETPKNLSNVHSHITGSVRQWASAAGAAAEQLGFEPHILTCELSCEAKDAGTWLAALAREHHQCGKRMALIAGGETVVKVTGTGKGGRNQELALSAAAEIEGLSGVCVISVGSDGTDGPTDAAGGIVDGSTAGTLRDQGICIREVLADNDAYHALEKVGGLVFTGPTGTNVNDVALVLLDTP